MKRIGVGIVMVASLMLFGGSLGLAQDQDVEGSKDHPLISRYPGSFIVEYDQKAFDEYELPAGKSPEGKMTTKHLEGEVPMVAAMSEN